MKKLIVYDLDGTLVDTGKDIARAANATRVSLGLSELPEKEIFRFVGKGLYHLIGGCLDTQDMKLIEKAARIHKEYYQKYMMDHSVLYPDVEKVLEYFKDRLQIVMTNKPNPFSTEMLRALKIESYFERIIAGDSEFPKKPNPAALLLIMKQKQIRPEEAVMVGDSLTDLETGRRAGIACAMLTHGFTDKATLQAASPDALFPDFFSMLEFVRKNQW